MAHVPMRAVEAAPGAESGSGTSTNIGASGNGAGSGSGEDITIPDEPVVDEIQMLPRYTIYAATHAQTPKSAVQAAAAYGSKGGVTTYISVVDRESGHTLAETPNANQHVQSESIFKLFVAAYYLVKNRGYQHTSAKMRDDLSYMIRLSDDAIACRLFRADIIPAIAKRYGLKHTANAAGRVGHWGAARITAHDMAQFMYRAANDPLVGPWLLPVMAKTAVHGVEGFNQDFGLNALSGEHGSKQGWGGDGAANTKYAINSVGYTDRYYVAVLTIAKTYPDPARAVATHAAKLIQASVRASAEGAFVRRAGDSGVYRVAGAAPIFVSSWAAVGGKHRVRTLDSAVWARLRTVPRDGTFVRAGPHGSVYRISGGALIHASAKEVRGKQITKPADGIYYPPNSVTRGAMAAYLYRIAGPSGPAPACSTAPFEDVATDGLFCGVITWIAQEDITYGVGDGTDYDETAPVTRQAMASFLHRVYDHMQ